jgi:hypothetical protein
VEVNKWKFCIVSPQDAALELSGGLMDEGDGCGIVGGGGFGYSFGDGWGCGVINGYGDGSGWGRGDGYGYGDLGGDGSSPEEWK